MDGPRSHDRLTLRLYESAMKFLAHNIAYRAGTRVRQYRHWGHLHSCASILLLLSNYISAPQHIINPYLYFYRYITNAFPVKILSASLVNILGLLLCLRKLDRGGGQRTIAKRKGNEHFQQQKRMWLCDLFSVPHLFFFVSASEIHLLLFVRFFCPLLIPSAIGMRASSS